MSAMDYFCRALVAAGIFMLLFMVPTTIGLVAHLVA